MTGSPTIDNYFVCIGAQKAGTTWLGRVLAAHPDIFVTPVKEIHYFDHIRGLTAHLSDRKRGSRYRKFHQRMWTQWHRFSAFREQWPWYRDYMRSPIDDAWYADLFRHRGSRRMAGELTPEYAIIGRDGFEHIQRLAPGARVIFIMRHPVTQTWSQVLHHCRSNGLDAGQLSHSDLVALLERPRFHEIANYGATLDDLMSVFPAEQCSLLFYEDMHHDRASAIAAVSTFIGVAEVPGLLPDLGQRFNRSQDATLPDAFADHLAQLHRKTADAVRRHVGHIPESWQKTFS
jgi:hypothetical protein